MTVGRERESEIEGRSGECGGWMVKIFGRFFGQEV